MTALRAPDLRLDPPPGPVFAALGHPVRRRILQLAVAQSRSVGDIVRACGLPDRTCRWHLSVLERCGLLVVRRGGVRVCAEALLPFRGYFDQALTISALGRRIHAE